MNKKNFIFLLLPFIILTVAQAENIWFHSKGNYQSQKYSELNQIN